MPFRNHLRYLAETTPDLGLEPFGEYKELQQEGRILLGCKGEVKRDRVVLDPTKPVYINYDLSSPNPPNFLILGKKGSGKTVLATNILHQLYRAFGCYAFFVDPKADLYSHKHPQSNPDMVHFLNGINLPPSGLPLKIITPLFLRSPKYIHTDQWYALGMSDFNSLQEFSVRHQMMESILGIHSRENDAPARKLDELLAMSPKSFAEMTNDLTVLNEKRQWKSVTILDTNLKQRLRNSVLADGHGVDIVEMMQSNIVVLQCSLATGELMNATYVAFALAQIKDGFEAGRFKGKRVCIGIDEADTLVPSGSANPPSKPFVHQMYTKWRSEGASCMLLAQDPSTLSEIPILQSDFIITPRVTYNGGDYKLIQAMFPNVAMKGILAYQLTKMYSGEMYPKEWAVIDQDQKVQMFFPFPSPSMTPPAKREFAEVSE